MRITVEIKHTVTMDMRQDVLDQYVEWTDKYFDYANVADVLEGRIRTATKPMWSIMELVGFTVAGTPGTQVTWIDPAPPNKEKDDENNG